MHSSLSPQNFCDKWRQADLKERSAAQEHFIDLCRLVGHPTPAEADPTGQTFTFEAGTTKTHGGQGWAGVWNKGYFAWEHKGKHKDLDAAYQQLLQYHKALDQPPLLVVSDMAQIIIHSKFTNTPKRFIRLSLDGLLTPEGLDHLRAVFYEPSRFRSKQTTEQVTKAAAARELVEKRDVWLNPEESRPDGSRRPVRSEDLKGRTLTNLYNARPTWLDPAHQKLDRAVLAAYGWPADLGDEQILEHLLALNLQRAGAHD